MRRTIGFHPLLARLAQFGLAGGIGFLVDAGLTFALVNFGFHPLVARIGGVAIAVLATWLLNRGLTFADRKSASRAEEAGRYTAVALTGCAVNYATYATAILVAPGLLIPLAVAIGSAVAMGFTYFGYSRLVFTG